MGGEGEGAKPVIIDKGKEGRKGFEGERHSVCAVKGKKRCSRGSYLLSFRTVSLLHVPVVDAPSFYYSSLVYYPSKWLQGQAN